MVWTCVDVFVNGGTVDVITGSFIEPILRTIFLSLRCVFPLLPGVEDWTFFFFKNLLSIGSMFFHVQKRWCEFLFSWVCGGRVLLCVVTVNSMLVLKLYGNLG